MGRVGMAAFMVNPMAKSTEKELGKAILRKNALLPGPGTRQRLPVESLPTQWDQVQVVVK